MKLRHLLAGAALIAIGLGCAKIYDRVIHPAHAQQTQFLPDGTVMAGHLTSTQPAGTPALPALTSATVVGSITDFAGGGSATATSGVAVVFAKPFLKPPTCIVLDHTTASGSALATEPTTTGFTLGTTVSGDKFSWICVGAAGN